MSTNSIFKNVNTYDNNGFRQRYWVISDDVNVITPTKQSQLSHSLEIEVPFNITKTEDVMYQTNEDEINLNYESNALILNDEIIRTNYIKTFCSDFFTTSCHLCHLIHNIGKKYGIECPHCHKDYRKITDYEMTDFQVNQN